MKRFIFCIAFSALYAAPVGNPSAPGLIEEGFFIPCDSWVDIRFGYEGDFISDARLKQYDEGHGRVDRYRQDTNAGTATFNIVDRFDIYGVLGSSRSCADWRFTDSVGDVHQIEIETHYDFLWGAGARAILFEWGAVNLGIGGRYEHCCFRPSWLTSDGVNKSTSGSNFHWHEWQVDLDISYQIDLLTPYIGLKYSNDKVEVTGFSIPIASNESGTNHFKNRTPVGVFIGCSLSTGEYFMLNVEGRLIDEEAVTISGDVRF
ncbi:MAG TPA: hypothetical protein VLE89_06300 [Chlamydiales bacterium]|nr:hypothetical protein [Chlamydiales bacterium]